MKKSFLCFKPCAILFSSSNHHSWFRCICLHIYHTHTYTLFILFIISLFCPHREATPSLLAQISLETNNSKEIADLVSGIRTLHHLCPVRFGANYRIQVPFQPLVRTLPTEGKFQPGAWVWVLSIKFPTEKQCPTNVSRSSVQFLSWRYKLAPSYAPGSTQEFLFI